MKLKRLGAITTGKSSMPLEQKELNDNYNCIVVVVVSIAGWLAANYITHACGSNTL